MKKSPLRKIGKIGRANLEANKEIRRIYEEKGLAYCEIQFVGCKDGLFLAPAHRHKRLWYQGSAERLSDFRQWIVACVVCHDKIEHNARLTEELFLKLRGKE